LLYPKPIDPDKKDQGQEREDRGGIKSLFIPRLVVAGSPNGSWYVSGTADWLPGIYQSWETRPGRTPCHKFHALCTETVLGVNFYGAHSVARTISFYGLGPASPPDKYIFGLDQSYGGVQVRMPLFDGFTVVAQVEGRHPEVPTESFSNSVSTNFTPSSLPGLTAQPTYVHSALGFTSLYRKISEPSTDDLPDPAPPGTPLLKHRTATTVMSEFAYHWYPDTSFSNSSFQQLTAGADLTVNVGAVVVKGVDSNSIFYGILEHYCTGSSADPRVVVDLEKEAKKEKDLQKKAALEKAAKKEKVAMQLYRYEVKRRDRCDFGTLDLKSHLVTSSAQSGNTIPFFMLPTVGGQDIDSRFSLRGFDNYRFRGDDTVSLQAEYTIPVYDPLGLLVFYDAGNAGDSLSALSFAHLRQDAGFGINLRIMRMPVAQVFLAVGSGQLKPGFALVKKF
jgi:hypothetical protein